MVIYMIKLSNDITTSTENDDNIDITEDLTNAELQYLYDKGYDELIDIKKASEDLLKILNTTVLGDTLLYSLKYIPESILYIANTLLPALLVGDYDIYLDEEARSKYSKEELSNARQELYNRLKETYLDNK